MLKSLCLSLVFMVFATLANAADFSKYAGVYRGFTQVDDDDGIDGEIEVTVSGSGLHIKIATGIDMFDETIAVGDFAVLSDERLQGVFGLGRSEDGLVGFVHSSGAAIMFNTAASESGWGLTIKSADPDNVLRSTHLHSPAQVERGLFDKRLASMRAKWGDKVPLLRFDGKISAQ